MENTILTLLIKMRDEQSEQYKDVVTRFEKISDNLHEQDKRLALVENTHRTLKRAMWTGGAGLLTMLSDLVVNHIPQWFKR